MQPPFLKSSIELVPTVRADGRRLLRPPWLGQKCPRDAMDRVVSWEQQPATPGCFERVNEWLIKSAMTFNTCGGWELLGELGAPLKSAPPQQAAGAFCWV